MSTLLLLSVLAAHADMPPPAGMKQVPYIAEVMGAPGGGEQALVVYPWSASNGAPTGEVAEIPTDGRVQFGRRVMGAPRFWLVPRTELPALHAMDDDARRKWFDAGNAVQCTGDAPTLRSQVTVLGPDEVVERFALDSVAEDACSMHQLGYREGIGTTGPQGCTVPAGCVCSTSSAASSGGLLAFLALLWGRRRRRN